jgi:N utilization substance protein B
MGLRRKSRELALQFLYGHDVQEGTCSEDELLARVNEFCACFPVEAKSIAYAEQLIAGICRYRQEIDGLLSRSSHNWRVERMAAVDRNILRIAAYEMKYGEGEVPATVAINEALEIAKRYAEPDSVGFINGILDGLQGKD